MPTILLCPGQGTQSPGMLSPYEDQRATVDAWSDIVGFDLWEAGTSWDADTIRLTRYVQPLLTATALLSWRHLREQAAFRQAKPRIFPFPAGEDDVVAVAGHSLGQIPAAALAGFLTAEDCLALAAKRGELMDACTQRQSGQMLILIGNHLLPLQPIECAMQGYDLHIANVNGDHMVVLGGPATEISRWRTDYESGKFATQEPPLPRLRLRLLNVSGAFHTPAMAPAQAPLAEFLEELTVTAPHWDYISNRTGYPVASPQSWREEIVGQLVDPVRWDLVMDYMRAAHYKQAIELAPAHALTPHCQRFIPGMEYRQLGA